MFFSLLIVGTLAIAYARRRNGTFGTIGIYTGFDTHSQFSRDCSSNFPNTQGIRTLCTTSNILDPKFDELVQELENIPLKPHDIAEVLISNPFNQTLAVQEIFILNSGADMNYVTSNVALNLQLGKSIGFTTQVGNGHYSYGYKSAITIWSSQSPFNVSVVIDMSIEKNILSKHFMEIAGLCHCPGIGFIPCNQNEKL